MNYKDALSCLEGLEVYGMVFGLDRIRELLGALGDPHHEFRSIHIAGTNGKGSTASYIDSVLREAGIRSALYTSPHLIRFNERISVAGKEISDEEVARYTEKIFSIIAQTGSDFQPTYFEVTTAMAFAYFADQGAELAVVETGLGGRLDATNLVLPELSVITNVALEHTDILGESLEEIAREKGGIVKTGTDVVTGESDPRVLAVLQEICERQGSRLIQADREMTAESVSRNRSDGSRTFDYQGEDYVWKGLCIHLLGNYQVRNAVMALGVIEALLRRGMNIPEAAIRRGLSAARWPGRMEVISREPFLILDGAHNPHAAQALVSTLEEDLTYSRLILVMGILQDKDIPAVLDPLLPLTSDLILTRPRYTRGSDPHMLAANIESTEIRIQVEENVPKAVDQALSLYEPGDLILVTGSLYTVGEAREYLIARANSSI